MDIIDQLSHKLSLSPDFKAHFLKIVETIHLPKKSVFIAEGKVCNHLGVVKEGRLFSTIQTSAGHELVNDFYIPGSFITSYRSFLTRSPSLGSVQVYSDSTLYLISYERYRQLEQSLDWLKLFKHISEVLFIRKCQKDTSFNRDAAPIRYKNLVATHPHIEQDFPQFLIASYLNIRPETLSRLKSLDLHQVKARSQSSTFGP